MRHIEPQAKRRVDVELPAHRRERETAPEQQAVPRVSWIGLRLGWGLEVEGAQPQTPAAIRHIHQQRAVAPRRVRRHQQKHRAAKTHEAIGRAWRKGKINDARVGRILRIDGIAQFTFDQIVSSHVAKLFAAGIRHASGEGE